jgi:hypothetical protein
VLSLRLSGASIGCVVLLCGCGHSHSSSSDARPTVVPHLIGLSTQAAINRVAASGLCVSSVRFDESHPAVMPSEVVGAQSPAAGRHVAPSSLVRISVAPAPGPSAEIISADRLPPTCPPPRFVMR